MTAADFAAKVRSGQQLIGYWVVIDAPVATERLARIGYDYVALDAQHGLLGYSGVLNGLIAVNAGGGSTGVVRVEANSPTAIGRALDAGAGAVIVPLVDNAEQAAAAVAAAKYPPTGMRSYGPMRSSLRIGPAPAVANREAIVLAMIETAEGLTNVESICATPGLDGVYVGPSDLTLALGAPAPGDPEFAAEFEAALIKIRAAAAGAGIAVGIHTPDGATAHKRLAEGFTITTIASDLVHLEASARAHRVAALG